MALENLQLLDPSADDFSVWLTKTNTLLEYLRDHNLTATGFANNTIGVNDYHTTLGNAYLNGQFAGKQLSVFGQVDGYPNQGGLRGVKFDPVDQTLLIPADLEITTNTVFTDTVSTVTVTNDLTVGQSALFSNTATFQASVVLGSQATDGTQAVRADRNITIAGPSSSFSSGDLTSDLEITIPSANTTSDGLMTTGDQSFAGTKTFETLNVGDITVDNNFVVPEYVIFAEATFDNIVVLTDTSTAAAAANTTNRFAVFDADPRTTGQVIKSRTPSEVVSDLGLDGAISEVVPSNIVSINAPADGLSPTYDAASGNFTWNAVISEVVPSNIVSTNAPADGLVPTYDAVSGNFTWNAGGIAYTVKTSAYTMQTDEGIIANTAGGGFTLTLPPTPSVGDKVFVADGGDWSVNNLIVARNGSTIEGLAEDLIFDVGGVQVGFIYDGSTWQVYPQTPAQFSATIDADTLQGLTAAEFATAAQGSLADTALQDASAFATAAQGSLADTALQAADLPAPQLINTDYTASPGDYLLVNTSVAPVTITMPLVFDDTDRPITIVDAASTFATNNVTLARNGHSFLDENGVPQAENYVIDTSNAIAFVYGGTNLFVR